MNMLAMHAPSRLERTRLSLYYPSVYLLLGGLALLFAPHLALSLMLSSGDYGDVFPRYLGVMSIGLGVLVVQIVRHRISVMYPTLIGVRVFFCAAYLLFFYMTHDLFFVAMLLMVGAGALATTIAWTRQAAG